MKNSISTFLRNNLAILALLLVTFIVYTHSLKGDFVWDDISLIKDNPYVHGNHIVDFFTQGMASNTEAEDNTVALYRPLVLVFFSLCHGLWGNDPVGYHVLLVLLHLANVALVYIVIRKLTSESSIAATLGAATFALHPARVESIAWISGVPDPLANIFLLGAMLAYIAFREHPDKWRYLTLSLLCFQFALWSKEVAIMFPLIVVAYDLIYKRKTIWPASILYIVLLVIYFATRYFALGSATNSNIFSIEFTRIVDFILGYSELLAYPVHIPYDMQIPEHPMAALLMWISAGAIALLAGYSWVTFNSDRKRALLFSAIWLGVFFWQAILITLSMNGYAPRYTYVPSVGAAIFAAILYGHTVENYPRLKASIMASFALSITFFGVITWSDIPIWRDEGSLFSKVVEVAPQNPVGYGKLGSYYLKQEDYGSAEKAFLSSLQNAKTGHDKVVSLLSLGTVYGITNKLEISERYLKEVLQITPRNSDALTGLGNLAGIQGRFTEAISFYEQAIAANPKNQQAAMNLVMAYEKNGQFDRAESVKRILH